MLRTITLFFWLLICNFASQDLYKAFIMSNVLRKTLKITGITLGVLIIAALLIPVLFKKQITNLVKKEANNNLAARVDFKDLSLSFFRHFPKISIALDDLSITGIGSFSADTLIAARTIDVSVNLLSIIKGDDIKVSGIYLDKPRIHALVNKEGKANWDIAKPSSDTTITDTSASAFKMTLKHYEINDGYILYKDEPGNMSAEISGLNHEGSGDFTAEVFTLSTKTKADAVNFTYETIPYLVNTRTDIDADIKIDNSTSTYTFKTDDIAVNNLKLSADGFFQLANDSTYNMDIKFKTPSNEFKDILSLIPAVYKTDFDKIKTDGSATFNGFVKGTYSPQQMPAYNVNLEIKDGFFQYPDLPKPVKNIQVALRASNADGQPDNAVIDISKGHLEMENEPFDFKLLFKNPETAQYIDAVAKGKINLAEISKFIKLEGNMKLGGTVLADIFAKGNMSALQNMQGNFTAGGFLDIRNLLYSSDAFPQPIQNGNIKVQIENSGGIADNTQVNISSGHVEVGNNPVDFTLQLKKPMSSIDFNGSAAGKFDLATVKQFTDLGPGTSLAGILNADLKFAGNKTAIDKKEYNKINLAGSTALTNIKYVSPDYPGGIIVQTVNASFNPKNVTIHNFSGSYLQSGFSGNGSVDNIIGYAMSNQPLRGLVNVAVDKMNLNDWMGSATESNSTTTSDPGASAAGPFLVPADLDLTLNAKAGSVQYDKVTYTNINGTLQLANETVSLKNIKAEALEGTLLFNGTYSTRTNKKQPDISISYDVKSIDIQKAFFAYNTIEKLMPIGKFLDGKLNSQLSVSGELNSDMMPDISSLTGKGNLLLLEGVLNKFAPLEKIANTLQIKELQAITVKDIKAFFEFAKGKVLVKPFTIKVKDIEMEIGGMHGIDQTIDYFVQMKVPRKYIGSQGNNLLNSLAEKANSSGIPVKLGDVVNLSLKLGGSITNPSIKTDLKEAAADAAEDLKQQAIDFARQKADTIKQTVTDSLNTIKKEIVNDVKEELKKQVLGPKDSAGQKKSLDSTKKNVEKTINNTLKNILKKPVKDSTGK